MAAWEVYHTVIPGPIGVGAACGPRYIEVEDCTETIEISVLRTATQMLKIIISKTRKAQRHNHRKGGVF